MQYVGINFIDTYFRYVLCVGCSVRTALSGPVSLLTRSGLYEPTFFPYPICGEAAGVIIELPKDDTLLQNEEFKSRGFKKGGKVALV